MIVVLFLKINVKTNVSNQSESMIYILESCAGLITWVTGFNIDRKGICTVDEMACTLYIDEGYKG